MKTVKVTMSEDSPWRPPLKVEVDGEEWKHVRSVGWSAKSGETQEVTLQIDAKLEVEYV